MSENSIQEVAVEPVVEKVPAQTDGPVKKTRSTKKVAEHSSIKISDEPEEKASNQKIISGPSKTKAPRSSNVHSKENGAIGSHSADRALAKNNTDEKKQDSEKKKDKKAIWSNKNIRWSDVGTLVKGYNIVNEEAARKWLAREGIREATPEEVAAYYGK